MAKRGTWLGVLSKQMELPWVQMNDDKKANILSHFYIFDSSVLVQMEKVFKYKNISAGECHLKAQVEFKYWKVLKQRLTMSVTNLIKPLQS